VWEDEIMEKIKGFIKTSILGGLAVILPSVILVLLFRWLFRWITGIIQPLTDIFISKGQFQEIVADFLVIAVILTICFIVGLIVRTKTGQFIQYNLEEKILQLAPGYPTIKSVVMQFIGKKESPLSSVALVRPFENKTLLTAFITETHADGRYTVFVPTGPNPTSGFIFHLQPELVHPVNIPVDEAIKSVIGCGMGSKGLIRAFRD
jgi:uncharacterized membrane protein